MILRRNIPLFLFPAVVCLTVFCYCGNARGNENNISDDTITEQHFCMPAAVITQPDITDAMKLALRKQAPWVGNRKIIRITVKENWRVQRNEFTGIPAYRTVIADVMLSSSLPDYYIVVPCIFKQKAAFLGLRYTDITYRMRYLWSIYKISVTNINTICDK